MDDAAQTYIPPPKTLPGFPKAKKVKRKGGRKRWVNDDGDILEWDSAHGKIERYNDRGDHKGEFDHNDGSQTKPAKPGRTVTPTILRRPKAKTMAIGYELEWFNHTGSPLVVGDVSLPETTEDEVRSVFDLTADERGDYLKVEEKHIDWLNSKTDVPIDLAKYEYFVSLFAE
jgi:hypothetical protein